MVGEEGGKWNSKVRAKEEMKERDMEMRGRVRERR